RYRLSPVRRAPTALDFRQLGSMRQGGELVGFVFVDERVDDLVEVAGQYFLQLVKREVDPMVGDAALREVVGADSFGAISRADEKLPLLRLFGLAPRQFGVQQLRLQKRHGAGAVLVLRALILAFDDDAAWQVGEPDGGV